MHGLAHATCTHACKSAHPGHSRRSVSTVCPVWHVQSGFQDFINKCDYMEVDDNKIRQLSMQNQTRARQREEQALRDKFLTKPLSEIVANDSEVSMHAYHGLE